MTFKSLIANSFHQNFLMSDKLVYREVKIPVNVDLIFDRNKNILSNGNSIILRRMLRGDGRYIDLVKVIHL